MPICLDDNALFQLKWIQSFKITGNLKVRLRWQTFVIFLRFSTQTSDTFKTFRFGCLDFPAAAILLIWSGFLVGFGRRYIYWKLNDVERVNKLEIIFQCWPFGTTTETVKCSMSNFRARLSSQKYFLLSYIFILIGKYISEKFWRLCVAYVHEDFNLDYCQLFSCVSNLQLCLKQSRRTFTTIHYMHRYVWWH